MTRRTLAFVALAAAVAGTASAAAEDGPALSRIESLRPRLEPLRTEIRDQQLQTTAIESRKVTVVRISADFLFPESHPVASNTRGDGTDNPAGRALNRRVEVRIRRGSG